MAPKIQGKHANIQRKPCCFQDIAAHHFQAMRPFFLTEMENDAPDVFLALLPCEDMH
jgi:hypothetical protein